MSQDGKNKNSGGGEDIEAFLQSLEDAEVPDIEPGDTSKKGKPTATATDHDDLDARFAELNELLPDDLPATQEESSAGDKKGAKTKKKKKKKSRKERAAEKKAAKARAKKEKKEAREAGEADQPAWKRYAKNGAKITLMALPMIVFVWVLGAFMGHVISAAWLIGILAVLVAVRLPFLARKWSKRGKVRWWAVGLGVLLTAVLVAPMPKTVGNTLTHYGHWPTAIVGEVAGWDANNALSNVGSATSRVVGSALGAEATEAMTLGSMNRLDGSLAPAKPAEAGATGAPAQDAVESQPEAAQPEAAQPEVAQPEAAQPEVAQPEAAQPEAAQPEEAQPEAAQPEAAQPEAPVEE